jgi:hypothetical protein
MKRFDRRNHYVKERGGVPMPDKDKKQQAQAANESTAPELNNPDFQVVLKALLAAYQPILEQQLNLAKNPQELQKEAGSQPPNCDDEFAEANALFGKFLSDDVALRLIPEKNRAQIGPIENWRWCLQHLRCCMIFGWLVCRGPRTFRAWCYYVYQYWICVRQSLGTPVANPPTEEERNDFRILIEALAQAYKPYLTDQLASVEFPSGIPEEVLNGTIDCFEGQADACAIFDRLLTTEAAQALLGKAAFGSRSQDTNFWFCRCWCLCSICFGCCLARARSFIDVLWCLVYYFRCLVDCFRPLTCGLTGPQGCVQEQEFDSAGVFRGVQIFGTAAGASCDHYTLQWRQSGIGPWQSSGIVYPGGAVVGACGVVGGLLGYLTTYPFVAPGLVEIQLCVYSSIAGEAPCCTTIFFELQRNLVWIRGLEGLSAATPPGLFDPTAQITDGAGIVRSFGTALRVFGSADVGGCSGQTIKRLTLSYQQGFTTTTAGAWTKFWEVDYVTSLELDAGTNLIFEDVLTKEWFEEEWYHLVLLPIPHFVCNVVGNYLSEEYWDTQFPRGPFPVNYPDPPVVCGEPPVATWNSTPLALPNCQSGRYTLRLTVEDTGGGSTDSLRQVWFDNKNIYGKIAQIGSIPACSTIGLSSFAGGSADCTKPWPAPLLGIAYDEYIEEGNFTLPSDNFGGYSLEIEKDGGSWHSLQIPGPGSSPWGPPFTGTSRIGDPGTRCPTAVPPPGFIPPPTNGILTMIDMRRLDSVCNTNAADADLVLQRATANSPGECCGFVVHLSVWDTSICPSLSGDRHQVDIYFPFCICNDLPPVG